MADSEPIVSWMKGQTPSQNIRHQTALAAWQPGTSRWFLDSSEYKDWTQRVTPRLVTLGNPSCGKNTLCAAVIKQLNSHVASRTVGIAYYYWHHSEDTDLKSTDLLRSLISQLCLHSQFNHEAPPPLQALFAQYKPSNLQPSNEEVIEVFTTIVHMFDACFIVMDGLEHCSDYSGFLEVVRGMEPRVCTLVTSRRSSRLGQFLENDSCSTASTCNFIIEEAYVTADVKVVLRAKSPSSTPQKAFMGEIIDIIPQRAEEMFSWAVFQVERVLLCDSECEARDVLDNLPTQIRNSWHQSLVRIFDNHNDVAIYIKHFLEILSATLRPLSLTEIEHFLEFYLAESSQVDQDTVPVDLEEIENICSDFLAVVTSAEVPGSYTQKMVKLVHPQLQILLFSDHLGDTRFGHYGISKTQAHLRMAESCLSYLLRFTEPIHAENETLDYECPLLQYAARYWYTHASIGDEFCLRVPMVRLFTSKVCFPIWLSVYDPDTHDWAHFKANRPSPLYYACLLGFCDLAKALLRQGARFDVGGGKHRFPLLAAVTSGHEDVVRLLLDKGDDANRRFKNGNAAIIRAASQGYSDIAQLLISHGANPDARDKRHLTALHWAVRQDKDDIVPILLASGANINAKDIDGRTALHYTLHFEQPNRYMFNILIDKGVDVLGSDVFGQTMLHYAVWHKDLECVQSLIAAGAQVDKQDHRGWTALQQATSVLWAEGVYYLLSSCYAEPDLRNEQGQTALHCTILHVIEMNDEGSENNYEDSEKKVEDPGWGRIGADIIRYLLGASADQSIKDEAGLTPLELARSSRSTCLGDVLKVLVSAQTQGDQPAVMHEKPQHLDESSPIKLPTLE